jgi:surfeit locus 1 family protein
MPIMTVLTALSLALLLMLGNWQWARYQAKVDLPPPGQEAAPLPVAVALEGSARDFAPVVAEGVMDGRTLPIYAVQDGVRGVRLFSPLVTEAGVIFVDRGFVPEAQANTAPAVMGTVQVRGVLRVAARANRFTPDNNLAVPAWYWPDTAAMATFIDAPDTVQGHYIAMTMVDPLKTGRLAVNPWADGKGASQVTPERHFGYALTWWGLAGALVGVYAAFHMRAGRLRFSRS